MAVRALVALAAIALEIGCSSAPQPPPAPVVTPPPTFTKDIAPIVLTHCAPCHRPGQPTPFSLLSYADLKERTDKIFDATSTGHMPPWLPESAPGEFTGDRRLSAEAKSTIARWIKEGAVEGNAADLPAAPVWAEGWQLGQPDLIVTAPRAFTVRPGDRDVFRNLVFPVALPANRFVRAVEFRPGAARMVHHAVISIDRTRTARRRDGADGQPGYDGMISQGTENPDGHFLGWTPGRGPIVAPQGLPWGLDRGSDLVVQLHLLPQAKPEAVKPTLGLYFTDTPPVQTPTMIKLGSKAIDIPAGERKYEISDTYVLPVDVELLSIYPHAHYLAREMHAMATFPDGTTRPLLRIRHWDFHWQQDYRYTSPVKLPRGTTLAMRFTYDNSPDNAHRPRGPLQPVVYGPNSSDEMGDVWLQVLAASPADLMTIARAGAERETRANIAGAELLVRRVPENARNQLFLGGAYAEAGRAADAVPHLEHALRLDPKSASAHNHLGGASLSLGKIGEAVAHFRQAAALDPRDERLPFNLGNALNTAGQPAEAARAFERALAINPDFGAAHDNLGIFLLSQNRVADALTHLRRAVELMPGSPDAHNDLAAALAQAGRNDEALEHVRRALDIQPDHGPARQNLAILQKRR